MMKRTDTLNYKLFAGMTLLLAFLMGCQPAPKRDNHRAIGRTAQGPINSANGQFSSFQSGQAQTSWGQITSQQGDQAFGNQLYYMTLPMLQEAGADQQLGYVSASANQNTNVVFWGEAYIKSSGNSGVQNVSTTNGSGTIDSDKARIHIEIWDDKAVAGPSSPVVLHIGYDFEGYGGATGGVQGNQANIVFTSLKYGSVSLQGTISGQYFSGQVLYSNASTGNKFYPLGDFKVPTCGFFACQ